jgi:hypothetical protein
LWRLPCIHSRKSINKSLESIDFFEPLDDNLTGTYPTTKKFHYLPRVSWKIVSYSEWIEQNLSQHFQAAPTILWDNFETWEAFTNHVKQRRSRLFVDSCRRQRKLEQELGSLQFVFDDRRPEVLRTFFGWKRKHLHRQGLLDRFTSLERMHFFEELAARQLLLVSSLGTEEHLLAIYIALLNRGRFYLWNAAYNLDYSQYSPGRLLLHWLLEQSFELRHQEFDLLWGDQEYKWYYATHARLIEEMGHRPLSGQCHHCLKAILNPFPEMAGGLKQLRNAIMRQCQKNLI